MGRIIKIELNENNTKIWKMAIETGKAIVSALIVISFC
jgi:hypothetical protein